MECVKRITNQELLEDIAKNDTHPWVRREALNKIADSNIKEELEMELDSKDIEQASENELYRKVIDYNESEFEREKYIDGINDEKILRLLAYDQYLYELRAKAIEKIHNQEFLKNLYMDTPEGHIRMAIINNIEDDEFLRFVQLNDPDIGVATQASRLLGEDVFLNL